MKLSCISRNWALAGVGAIAGLTGLACRAKIEASSAGSGGHGGDAGGGKWQTGNGIDLTTDADFSGSGRASSWMPSVDANCGEHQNAMRGVADVLLILDMSGSMTLATATGESRYEAVTAALDQALPATNDTMNWGLMMYPAREKRSDGSGSARMVGSCAPGEISVGIVPNNAKAVAAEYSNQRPEGFTPTALSIERAVTYLQALSSKNPKYIVLATDGQPNCTIAGSPTTVDDKLAVSSVTAAKNAGIPVFVVGVNVVGDQQADQNAPAVLNNMAEAGGMPSAEPNNKFYVANSTAQMVGAMKTIGTRVASCLFRLPSVPPVPNNVLLVFEDGKRLLAGAQTWSYEDDTKTAVQLHGEWCRRVMDGTYTRVQILYGCPGREQLIP